MSITKFMNIGVSGLRANGVAMAVIGDNIANVNTIGYKGSRTNFSDVLARTTLGIGDGVASTNVQQEFTQGSIMSTGSALDLAITGPGFLVVQGVVGGRDGQFYTRAGMFGIDNEGYVANMQGFRLQGYQADSTGALTGKIGDLTIGGVTAPPKATEEIEVRLNLDPEAPLLVFDPTDPAGTSNFSNTVTVYDSLGNAIPATVYYNRTGTGTWDYHVFVDGGNLTGGTAGTPTEISTGAGQITFDTGGVMTANTQPGFDFNPLGATNPQPLDFDLTGSTQFAGDSSLRFMTQDGFAAGELNDVSIDTDGSVYGIFSNGESVLMGKVLLASFAANEGLERMGQNLWGETRASGQALLGEPGSGGRGTLVSGALEGSNVDLAHEFVKMIAVQRGFQANSKTIQTGDQMLQEVINLKR